MYGYVYELVNLTNGKKYIGKHKSSDFDPNYQSSGKLVRLAISKYGWSNFSVRILCPCFSEEELNSEEEFLVGYFDCVANPNYYNQAKGGYGGGARGRKLSKTSRLRISRRMIGENNPNYGKSRSLATREKIRNSNLGQRRSPDTCIRISESLSNKKLSDSHRASISAGLIGHKISDETKGKISQSLIGREVSDNTRQKMRDAAKRKQYHLICQNCGSGFLSEGSRTRYCPNCNERR